MTKPSLDDVMQRLTNGEALGSLLLSLRSPSDLSVERGAALVRCFDKATFDAFSGSGADFDAFVKQPFVEIVPGAERWYRVRDDDRRELAFLGRIAAGRPIEALSGRETIAVPSLLFGDRAQDHYVLRVVGDSMIDEGIHDGDWVVIERRERAVPGEMVVALVGDEVTLKRFYPEGERVRLQPANPAMSPLRVTAADVRVQGIVVGLMRRY